MVEEDLQIVKEKWKNLLLRIEKDFGMVPDLQVILFLIGVQELGKGNQKFSKDEKQNLMHIGTCKVLGPSGYYKFKNRDEEGWPHYELVQPMPTMSLGEQDLMLRKAVIRYFEGTS